MNIDRLSSFPIESLLDRPLRETDQSFLSGMIENKTVMVTGGGGSIGSELCRQIAGCRPKLLVIVDNYENNVYELSMELKRKNPELAFLVRIASVQCKKRMEELFRMYRPHLVFHAAAHKHVPMMEENPGEAIKNNVLGTLNVAKLAEKYRTEKFILISSDKAVRPVGIMGATKRICEMIMQAMAGTSDTVFAAVRFGNVLGSSGSVVPLFLEQIKNGGPVTVTHREITRYFMTIPEAAGLVLLAGAYAGGGEIYVLDMGEPVNILALAEKIIEQCGYRPGIDMNIVITGLRPGEKLYEELLIDEDRKMETKDKRIFIGQPPEFDEKEFWKNLKKLKKAAQEEDPCAADLVREMVLV